MKIVHSDDLEAREGGSLTVVMEESDDLWVLYNLVDPDDTVRCGTLRKVNKSDKAGAKAATEKRRVTLSVRAIASEYDGIADVVRVSGVNVAENDYVKMGAHHTLEVGIRTKVTVTKGAWATHQREAVKRAADAAATAELVALLMDADRGEARLYVLTEALVKSAAAVDVAMPKNTKAAYGAKSSDAARLKFRRKCREALAAKVNWDAVKCVAICGNGGKDFLAWLRSDGLGTDLGAAATDAGVPALKKHVAGGAFCVAGPQIKETHKDALRVLLKEPAVKKRVADTSVARFCAALDAFGDAQRRDADRCLFGSVDAATQAADRAALATLLVLDEKLRGAAVDVDARRKHLALVEAAAASGAEVLAFPSRHVAAEGLRDLGGVACVLRYPCPDLQDVVDFLPDAPGPPAAPSEAGTVVAPPPAPAAAHVETKKKAPPKPPAKKKAAPKPKVVHDDDYDDGYDDRYDGYDY